MSSNSATVKTNSSPAPSIMSAVSGEMVGIIIAAVVAIACYISSFVMISQFVGSKDDWAVIKPQIQKVWLLTLAGSFALFVASILYYVQDPKKAIYFILVLTCLSFGLSYSALAVSAISK